MLKYYQSFFALKVKFKELPVSQCHENFLVFKKTQETQF